MLPSTRSVEAAVVYPNRPCVPAAKTCAAGSSSGSTFAGATFPGLSPQILAAQNRRLPLRDVRIDDDAEMGKGAKAEGPQLPSFRAIEDRVLLSSPISCRSQLERVPDLRGRQQRCIHNLAKWPNYVFFALPQICAIKFAWA